MKYDDAQKIAHHIKQRAESSLALRALGVTDLPGDAPNSPKSSDGSPGNLPGEPTQAMIVAGTGVSLGACHTTNITNILRAALAAAPRVEVPEITREDAEAVAMSYHKEGSLKHISPSMIDDMEYALRVLRARLVARMGGKS